jgi:hypothetical protein
VVRDFGGDGYPGGGEGEGEVGCVDGIYFGEGGHIFQEEGD